MDLNITNNYTSAGCNPSPLCSSFGRNNLLAYAVTNSIFICDPNKLDYGAVIQTLIGHKDKVTCVRWVPKNVNNTEPETLLISSSSDKSVIIWSSEQLANKWSLFHTIKTDTIVENSDAIPIFNSPDKQLLVVTVGDHGAGYTIWIVKENQCQKLQKLSLYDSGSIVKIIQPISSGLPLFLLAPISKQNYGLYFWENDSFNNLNLKLHHSNFVNGIDYIHTNNDETLIATTAHDYIIRLWRIKLYENNQNDNSIHFKAPEQIFEINNQKFKLELEALLKGHENWIHGIQFNPKAQGKELVSASHDRYLLIFRQTEQGIWTNISRFGNFGGYFVGFNGAGFSPDGNILYSYTYTGAFHVWKRLNELSEWEPHVFSWGGHIDEIADAVWESKGKYILTAGKDKTTRVFSPGKHSKIPWHEISRPQVHGYELTNIVSLGHHQFCSGGAEKLVRMFQAPQMFFNSWMDINNEDIHCEDQVNELPLSADFQALELSNKPIYVMLDENSESNPREILKRPPTDDFLQKSRWPEIHKFYGHGYDIASLAPSPDLNKNGISKMIATSCKTEHKTPNIPIILWDTENFKEISRVHSEHNLTIIQLAFSPNGQYLLSVSRDRKWCLFTKKFNVDTQTDDWEQIEMISDENALHKRALWACAWTHDSRYFVTGSRDGKLAIWSVNETTKENQKLVSCIPKGCYVSKDSITSLDFSPTNFMKDSKYLLVVGLENGKINIFSWEDMNDGANDWKLMHTIDNSEAHHLSVKRVMFRPLLGRAEVEKNDGILQLLSCGADSILRIYNICIP